MVTANTVGEETRTRIMTTAFNEFYHRGFQGASLNRIVEEASTTKGALFHHFRGKVELGHAVVDEILYPKVKETWVEPLDATDDPATAIADILGRLAEECEGDTLCQGCPLNNLSQEMSPLDEGFRVRLERIYSEWRRSIEQAFQRGIEAKNVRQDAEPRELATFLVAVFAGTIGTAKNAQDPEILKLSGSALLKYLETLRP